MKTKKQLLIEKEKIEKQLKQIKNQEALKEFIEVSELGIKITKKQRFNGKTYSEILKEVDESQIATYDVLQKLRNISFESGWKKYTFMKDFWVFVPNPDKSSKEKYVARFYANSFRAYLDCNWGPSGRFSDLGVFLYCSLKPNNKRKEKKQ